MQYHTLDSYPSPKGQSPTYVNEPWIIDKTLLEYPIEAALDEVTRITLYARKRSDAASLPPRRGAGVGRAHKKRLQN